MLSALINRRRDAKIREQQRARLQAWAQRLADLDPCPNPDCIAARREIAEICAGKPVR